MSKNNRDAPIILAPADMRSALAIGRSFARHGISFIPAVTDTKHFACFSRYFRGRLVKVANPRSNPDKFAEQILPLAGSQGASGLPPALVAEWEGDFDARFLRASAAIDAIEKAGGLDITHGSSVPSWGPETATAVVNELSLPADPAARPASKEQLDAFTKSADRPENADLVWAWGRDAAHNLGIINTRFLRLEASTTPEAWGEVEFLMSHLEAGERKAIFDVLIEA